MSDDVYIIGVGMIKFGSRTELLVPSDRVAEIAVKIGSKVRAGSTILARIRRTEGGN